VDTHLQYFVVSLEKLRAHNESQDNRRVMDKVYSLAIQHNVSNRDAVKNSIGNLSLKNDNCYNIRYLYLINPLNWYSLLLYYYYVLNFSGKNKQSFLQFNCNST